MEEIATAALEVGRLLLQSSASSSNRGLPSDATGGFAIKTMSGLFGIAQYRAATTQEAFLEAMSNGLHGIFTLGAIGTGLAIPILQLKPKLAK